MRLYILFQLYFLPVIAQNCYIGSYRASQGPWNGCAGYKTCEEGNYCIEGRKFSCPPKTFGGRSGLTTAECSGDCPPGHYCPAGTINPLPCGNSSYYCPKASSRPLPIPIGYYGTGNTDFKLFSEIAICPKGSYCTEGYRYPCLPGYWGDSEGLSSSECSGECPAGWYCPSGTAAALSHPCLLSPTMFCPKGSSRQFNVNVGYYAIESHIDEGGGYGSEAICPAGSYCLNGVRTLCPGGRFGAIQQMTQATCSGVCKAGWYCPPGSTSSTQEPCGDSDVYCPEGSQEPIKVPAGYYTVGEKAELSTGVQTSPIDALTNFNGEVDGDNFHKLNKLTIDQCQPGYYCAADGTYL